MHIVSEVDVKKLIISTKIGEFHVFVSVEAVSNEKTLYLKEVYLLQLGNRAWKESNVMDMVRTERTENEDGLKRVLAKYIQKRYHYQR